MTLYRKEPDVALQVGVSTPARLHLGFLDLGGSLGRRFGSLGVAIDGMRTGLRARLSQRHAASGPGSERALVCLQELGERLGLQGGVTLELNEAIPDHAGLGSGTQLYLAIGAALDQLYGLGLTTAQLALAAGRGRRSGIGIGAFDHGGFLMDAGTDSGAGGSAVPPLTARLDFPEHWRILLLMDGRGQGLHGGREKQAFRELPPFPEATAAHLCHLALMKILPGVAEARLAPVAEGIAELQRVVGDHFAPAQGGRFASPAVSDALAWAEAQGHVGIGQSSWGPTGFVLLDSEAVAQELAAGLRRRFGELSPLRVRVVAACNRGRRLHAVRADERLQQIL